MSSAISNAVKLNNYAEVEAYLLEAKRQNREWRDDNSIKNACAEAIEQGFPKIVQLFLDKGLSSNTSVSRKKRGVVREKSLIHIAAKVGNFDIVKILVDHGAVIKDERKFFASRDPDNQEAMRSAIKKGNVAIVQYLLEKGGSVNGVCTGTNIEHEQTFLGRAAFNNQNQLVDLFVKHGADIKGTLLSNYRIFNKDFKRYNKAIKNYEKTIKKLNSKEKSTELLNKMQEFINERDILLQKYYIAVRIILDHAMGINFETQSNLFNQAKQLKFLKDLDISNFNFIGISIDCQPINRKMLIEQCLKGSDQALITFEDLNHMKDKQRQSGLLARLDSMVKLQGEIVSEEGIYNLVSLADAAQQGDEAVVRVRLAAGMNPNQITTGLDSSPALVAATKNGFFEIVKLLSEHSLMDPKTRVLAGEVAKKHAPIAEYLSSLIDVNEKDHLGNAQIHHAVLAKDIEKITKLLERGADINLENGEKKTALYIAAEKVANFRIGREATEKNIELLQFLLSNGADPNKHSENFSPLRAAAMCGSYKAVELLLPVTERKDLKRTHGLDGKEITYPWYVPLMFESAESNESLQILRALKGYGADLNARQSDEDPTILHLFVQKFSSFRETRGQMQEIKLELNSYRSSRDLRDVLQNNYDYLFEGAKGLLKKLIEKLDFMLQNGANPALRIERGNQETALHCLLRNFNLSFIEGATEEVIGRFLNYVDINTPDGDGFTPLHIAIMHADLTTVTYLISKNADILAKTKTGLTPLHLAAAGNPEVTALLIEKGADMHAQDAKGRSPLEYSMKQQIANNRRYVEPSSERDAPYNHAQTLLYLAMQEQRKQ